MTRASKLLERLSLLEQNDEEEDDETEDEEDDEQEDEEPEDDDNDDDEESDEEDEEDGDPNPFSKENRNSDGSIKVGNKIPINDKNKFKKKA